MGLQLVDFLALVEWVLAVSDRSEFLLLICAVNKHLFAVDQQDAGDVGVCEYPSRCGDVVFDEILLHSLALFGLLYRKGDTVFGVILT